MAGDAFDSDQLSADAEAENLSCFTGE